MKHSHVIQNAKPRSSFFVVELAPQDKEPAIGTFILIYFSFPFLHLFSFVRSENVSWLQRNRELVLSLGRIASPKDGGCLNKWPRSLGDLSRAAGRRFGCPNPSLEPGRCFLGQLLALRCSNKLAAFPSEMATVSLELRRCFLGQLICFLDARDA